MESTSGYFAHQTVLKKEYQTQKVYDAAEWSSLVELSEQSILHGSAPVVMPDFTRGEWDKIQGLTFAVLK